MTVSLPVPGDAPVAGPGHCAGQPLLVRSNDYANRLLNGDPGVVQQGDELVAAF